MEENSIIKRENRVANEAKEILDLPENKSSSLHGAYRNLLEEYEKLTNDYQRVVKISDQQQYLIEISEETLKEEVCRRTKAEALLEETEAKLTDAKESAESSLETKSQFLAVMSHEIRTPLNGILGGANLLKKILTVPNHIDLIDMILSSGEILLSSINDLLDYSKIESGKFELESIPIDIYECIENSIEAESSGATEKKIDLIFNSTSGLGMPIFGDRVRVTQILVNLINNAVKFTNKGEVVVTLDEIERVDDKVKLYIEVKDTGIGIHPSRQKNIFKAFTQVDASRTRQYSGTGLGLSICKKLVELHKDGQIGVTSVPDKGATFYFSFWAHLETEPVAETIYEWKFLGGIKALLIEDNQKALRNLEKLTTSWGLDVDCALRPDEAIQHINNNGIPDLLIIDTDIFSIDPVFLSLLFTACENRKIPTIYLKWADEKQSFNSSHIIQIEKPFRTNKLRNAVERLISHLIGKESIPVSEIQNETTDVFSNLSILLAEDQPINQKIAVATFEILGCKVKLVENGYEAVTAAQKENFDFVFMDLRMPMMDGIEATRKIRQLGGDQPKIIAMTANIRKEDREDCVSCGMDDFIAKPISPELLSKMLSKWQSLIQGYTG